MVAGCIGLNLIIATMSILALITVVCRRFETFSSFSLFVLASASVAILTL